MCRGTRIGRVGISRRQFRLCAAVLLAAAGSTAQAVSDITADGTLGTQVNVAGPAYNITGGTRAGSNLFHSFDTFSVSAGDAAVFYGPAGTANIISRVTGGSVSSINGTIASAINGANLYLLNPAGVMFGPSAQLSVSGAFHASTADYVGLSDGSRFYADTNQASTLSAAAPAAFGFLGANPAGVSVSGSRLTGGGDIGLVGGEIALNDAFLYAPFGRTNLAAVGPGSAAGVEATLTAGAVVVDGFDMLGPVTISGGSVVDTPALYIRGGQITVAGAYLSPGAGPLLFGLQFVGLAPINNGLIDIQASGDLTIQAGSNPNVPAGFPVTVVGSTLQALFFPGNPPSLGNGATVLLEAADTLSIQGAPGSSFLTIVGTDRWQTGPAGELVFKAEQIEVLGTGDIYADNHAAGAGPSITVEAQTVTLNNGALRVRNFGAGDNGQVEITADAVTLSNQFGASDIGVDNYGSGDGGAIVIDTDSLELNTPGAGTVLISGRAFAPGSGASVQIGSASDPAATVLLQGTGAAAQILTSTIDSVNGPFATGQAGDIAIYTGTLTQIGDTEIGANSFSNGDGGNVTVIASEAVRMSGTDAATGSVIAAGTANNAVAGTGAGGSITIESPLLEISNASITTRTQRASNGGDVTITVGTLAAADSTINSDTFSDGNAGSVTVSADRVTLTDGAQIRSFSGAVSTVSGAVLVGTGDAGTVTVTATQSLSVSGSSAATNRSSALNTQTRGVGAGGALTVDAGQLTVGAGGLVAADTGGDGDGGALNVTADSVVVDGGEISSGSGISVAITGGQVDLLGSGNGGDVTVQAVGGVTVSNGGRIAASSQSGVGDAGNVLVAGGSKVQLIGGSIETESLLTDGGDIKVDALELVYLFGGKITTSVVGAGGTGGNIDIDPEFVVLQNGSQVIANATNPLAVQAGNIRITGDFILISQDSLVQASGPTNAQDGQIIIEGPDGDLARALAQLPESYLEAAGLLKAGCGIGRSGGSTLVLSGRGGVPVGPDRYASSLATGFKVDAETTAQREDLVPDDLLAFGPDDPTATGWLLAGLGCQ